MNPDHFQKNNSKSDMKKYKSRSFSKKKAKNDINLDHFLKPNSTNYLKNFQGKKKKKHFPPT